MFIRVVKFILYTFVGWFLFIFISSIFTASLLTPEEDGAISPASAQMVMWISLASLVAGPAFAFWMDRRRISKRKSEHLRDTKNAASEKLAIRDLVNEHKSALSRNVRRALRLNDYGAVVQDNRAEAIFEFLQSFGLPKYLSVETACCLVLGEIESIKAEQQATFAFDSLPTNAIDFEHWVARALVAQGWEATPTQASGDQGIDVIAKKNGRTVGIQCKLYSSALGNKAVQEALAGKSFYGLDKAAVVTTSSYTVSAKELATASGVYLMTIESLSNFDVEISK